MGKASCEGASQLPQLPHPALPGAPRPGGCAMTLSGLSTGHPSTCEMSELLSEGQHAIFLESLHPSSNGAQTLLHSIILDEWRRLRPTLPQSEDPDCPFKCTEEAVVHFFNLLARLARRLADGDHASTFASFRLRGIAAKNRMVVMQDVAYKRGRFECVRYFPISGRAVGY